MELCIYSLAGMGYSMKLVIDIDSIEFKNKILTPERMDVGLTVMRYTDLTSVFLAFETKGILKEYNKLFPVGTKRTIKGTWKNGYFKIHTDSGKGWNLGRMIMNEWCIVD
jgi:hypothetical protein